MKAVISCFFIFYLASMNANAVTNMFSAKKAGERNRTLKSLRGSVKSRNDNRNLQLDLRCSKPIELVS